MIIVFETNATEGQIKGTEEEIRKLGLDVHRSDGAQHTILGVVGDRSRVDIMTFKVMPGIRDVVPVSSPYKLASRDFHPEDSVVYVKDLPVGGREVVMIAGPCAVESQDQIRSNGSLRGGKRCTNTARRGVQATDFAVLFSRFGRGSAEDAPPAADPLGLAIVTEVMTIEQIDLVSRVCGFAASGRAQYAELSPSDSTR